MNTCVPPFPSRRQSYQSCHDKSPEERISYCTGPLETRAEFDFSDDSYSENNSDSRNNSLCGRADTASYRSSPRNNNSPFNMRKDIEQSHMKQRDHFPKKVSSHFGSELEAEVDCPRDFLSTSSQPQPSRYHLRQPNKHETMSSRHRKSFTKSHIDALSDKTDASEVETNFIQKLHRSHRPKTATGLQTATAPHPKRNIERVGLHVSINDCVCIASSADLGTATDSKTNLTNKNKRHVFTWASRTPAEINESTPQPPPLHQESGSGTQVDTLSSTPQPPGCNCICQPQSQPQSAADYYHMMQGRQDEFGGRDGQQGPDARGGRDGVGGAGAGGYGAGGVGAGGYGAGGVGGAGYGVGGVGAGGYSAAGYGTGAYGTGGYGPGGYGTGGYGAGGYGAGAYGPGGYDTAAYGSGAYGAGGYHAGATGTGSNVLGENMAGSSKDKKDGVYSSRSRKRRKGSLRDWQDPHKLYPDPLAWGGERPFRWEDNLRTTETNALIAVHPQRWMPVGKQQYSHNQGYPSWPDAITNMLMPWSSPMCYDFPQSRQTMTCCPGSQFDSTPACCPVPLRNCYCDNNGVNDSSNPRQTCAC